MHLKEEKKSGVFSWLVSVREYKRRLFGLGRGMHSTEHHPSFSIRSNHPWSLENQFMHVGFRWVLN